MFFVRPEYRDSIWSCWDYNPFHKITKDSVLKSSLLKRFTDTFRVLGGKFRSKDTDMNKQVGLIEYLLIPIDIIENLLYYSFIGRPIAYLLMGIHIILEGAIAGILTAVLTPVILITHVTCQLIKFFVPPSTITPQSTKTSQSRNVSGSANFYSTQMSSTPFFQPQSQPTANINKGFIWVLHPLGGQYTVLKEQETDKHLFFWLNNSNDLYVTENKTVIMEEGNYNATLWGNAVAHDYSTKEFETQFPKIGNTDYQNYQPINPAEILENTISTKASSKVL